MTSGTSDMSLARSPSELVRLSSRQFSENAALHIPLPACLSYSTEPITLSYSELATAINQASALWVGVGIRGRVALVLENRPDFFIHWLALNNLGISVIPLNHELSDDEIPYYLEHGKTQALLCLESHLERMKRICDGLTRSIPCVTPVTFGDLKVGEPMKVAEPDLKAECALLYTSGSTGKPKGCILSNNYFVQQGIWYSKLDGYIKLREGEERLLTPLPLSHMNAMAVSSMAMFITGGCLIQLDRFHPASWWESIRMSQATALHYLGILPAILLDLPESSEDDFSRQIRFGFGAGVNPRDHFRFEQRFGFPLIEAWAMTECGAGGAIVAHREPRHVGSCCFGRPSAELDWQIVDEFDLPVGVGEPGELRVRAAGDDPAKGYFSGYLDNRTATEEIWRDGWLNTGDIVRELEDGSLIFMDRKKNIIRRSGENISALEVESVMSGHASIHLAFAAPVIDELRGDEVAVCVELEPGEIPSMKVAKSIQQYTLSKLAYFKAPGWVVFRENLPVTASNKPRRADIKQLAQASVNAGKAFDLRSLKVRKVS